MLTTNVKELRAHLPQWLAYAKGGEEVTVLNHGKPVARIMPIPQNKKSLPSLREFRTTLKSARGSLSEMVIKERRSKF